MCKFSQQAKINEIHLYLLAVLLWDLGAALLGHLAANLAGNLLAALLGNAHALRLRNLFALLVGHVHRLVHTGLDRHLLAILRRGSVAWIRLVAGQALLVVVRRALLLQLAPVRRGANLLEKVKVECACFVIFCVLLSIFLSVFWERHRRNRDRQTCSYFVSHCCSWVVWHSSWYVVSHCWS